MSEVKKVNYISDDVKFEAVLADNEVWIANRQLASVLKRHPGTILQNAAANFGADYQKNPKLCRPKLPGLSGYGETAFSSRAVKDLARLSHQAVLGLTLRKWAANLIKSQAPEKAKKVNFVEVPLAMVYPHTTGEIPVLKCDNEIWMDQDGLQRLLGIEQWKASRLMIKIEAKPRKYKRTFDGLSVLHYNSGDVRRLTDKVNKTEVGECYYTWAGHFIPADVAVNVALKTPEAGLTVGYDKARCSIGPVAFDAIVHNGEAWITQKQMAELFGVTVKTVSEHIQNIVRDRECESEAVIRNFLTTASDGKRYDISHYASLMVQHVGYRVKSDRGIEYRQWVSRVVRGEAPSTGELTPQTALSITRLEQAVRALAETMAVKLATIDDHEKRIQALESPQAPVLPKLLPAVASAPLNREKSLVVREAIGARVRAYASKNGIEIQDSWRLLYDKFKGEYHYDLRKASEESGITKLDVADREGMLMQLYAVAVANFQ